tara:strand:+ start:128 stop:1528 length:1401 start_codon:yes stop_codon:yes gene_type:complete
MIPESHICFLVENFVDSLDFSKFDKEYLGAGAPAYHPRILMKILVQGMISKERSSRRLARICRENFVFVYLSEKVQPDFRTICRFRKSNASFIKEALKQTLTVASSNELLDLDTIFTDGTTIKANANKKRSIKREAVDILDKAIDKMMEEDIRQDELDMELYGDTEEGLTNMDREDMKRIVREYRKKNSDNVKKRLNEVKEEVKKSNVKKVSLTDPESRMMQNKSRVTELCYNAQFSVDKNQFILAVDACQDGHDANQLVPQIEKVRKNVELKEGTKVALDCGYSSGENIKFLEDNGLEGYIPSRSQAQEFDGKRCTLNHDKYEYDWEEDELIVGGARFSFRKSYTRKDGRKIITYYSKELKRKKDVPLYFRERLRMRDKMKLVESKRIYRLRGETVESVIGNAKHNLGFREFLLRGLEGVNIELSILGIAHNLGKIWRMSGVKGRVSMDVRRILYNLEFRRCFLA